VCGSSSPGCVLEVVVIKLDAPQEKRFPKSYGQPIFLDQGVSFNKTNTYATVRRDARSGA
jgi:hypothetical protein